MAERQTKTASDNASEKVKRAHGILADVRKAMYRRLADYILKNEARIRAEMLGDDTYSFCAQQMEEQLLHRLSVVERAVAELGRQEEAPAQTLTTIYEVVEVAARREETPQKLANALAAHGQSDLLAACVLRADETFAEILLIMAREGPAPKAAAAPAPAKPAAPPAPGPPSEPGGGDEST